MQAMKIINALTIFFLLVISFPIRRKAIIPSKIVLIPKHKLLSDMYAHASGYLFGGPPDTQAANIA